MSLLASLSPVVFFSELMRFLAGEGLVALVISISKTNYIILICVSGGKSYCKCKNDHIYPDCEDNKICSESRQRECQKNNGQCVEQDFQAICICNDKQGTYPFCTEVIVSMKIFYSTLILKIPKIIKYR